MNFNIIIYIYNKHIYIIYGYTIRVFVKEFYINAYGDQLPPLSQVKSNALALVRIRWYSMTVRFVALTFIEFHGFVRKSMYTCMYKAILVLLCLDAQAVFQRVRDEKFTNAFPTKKWQR